MAANCCDDSSCISSIKTTTPVTSIQRRSAQVEGQLGQVHLQRTAVSPTPLWIDVDTKGQAAARVVRIENDLKVARAALNRSPMPHEPVTCRSDWFRL